MNNKQIKLKEKLQVKYLDVDYKFYNQSIKDQHMLQVEIVYRKNSILIKCPTMAVYFEDNILAAAQSKWKNKKIFIGYKSKIPLRFYAYREFMKGINY